MICWPNMVFFFFFFPNTYSRNLVVALAVAAAAMGGAMGDSSKEKEECTEQLAGLATCLPYVGGQAKSPTPDCCNGLKQLLKNNKKCLCVIIKDRNDPDIGSLQINITLAMSLPNVCNAPANISKCPELLHMDPKSPEAQIFYQLDKASNKTGADAPAAAPTPAAGGASGGGSSSQEASAPQKSEAVTVSRSLFGLHAFLIGLFWASLEYGSPLPSLFLA